MRIESMTLGAVATNCYFLINEETKETILMDPADRADRIREKADREGLTLKAVFLTHGHGDHILAVRELQEEVKLTVYACEAEEPLLQDPNLNLSLMLFGRPVAVDADVLLRDGQEFTAAGMRFKVFHTPGHTPGGCCYYQEEAKALFSGDTLFCGSIGRTDFPGGSLSQLVRSVKEKLLTLPDEVQVYPGHESATSIGQERKYNPYF